MLSLISHEVNGMTLYELCVPLREGKDYVVKYEDSWWIYGLLMNQEIRTIVRNHLGVQNEPEFEGAYMKTRKILCDGKL